MRLFVYGTLKSGHHAHDRLLAGFDPTFIGQVRTTPKYHLYRINWFPGMVIDDLEEGTGVEGELYEVDEECLQAMDAYEGIDSGLFRREEIELADGGTAIGYLFNQPFVGKERIQNGIWE